ncbi:hypothetical protein ETB97_012155 [Aspergillus alliaceus]|uniref:Nucleoside phosphorylase domain-containing protein n=1 Tax=Petromyces alliaceus TaxID=209559 RepID=A0A8H6A7Q7_PETAA|nr:hypothetical protein ETB97_012155 [Aspergillus burnettii]
MSNDLQVWLEPKRKSVEGHTAQCTLSFNGRVIWGPRHCHNNTYQLRDALSAADSRFQLAISNRHKTVEGHTYSISVKSGSRVYLNRLSTHGHMKELCQAINDCLATERGRTQPGKPDPALPSQSPPQQRLGPPRPQATRPNGRQDFEIAIICALKVERDAIEAFLDEEFEVDGFSYGKAPGDPNAYTTGRIGQRAVVLVSMPDMGKVSSARVATGLRMSFAQVKVVFLVGVCGTAPRDAQGRETFLGDIMISTAVIQVDFGRQYSNEFLRKDTLEDTLGRPNHEIRSFLQKLAGKRTSNKLEDNTLKYVAELCAKDSEYAYPAGNHDMLYRADYRHKHQNGHLCSTCVGCNTPDDPVCGAARELSCAELGCSSAQSVPRKREGRTHPILHFGRFASGDSVMKSGVHRDKLIAKEQVIAFEMEGAGFWDCLPTVIIKSACDYADSHKNKAWQKYAAATAAACTKAVLDEWRSSQGA